MKKPEVGGVSVAVQRHVEDTTFVALHEPFEHDKPAIDRFERIAVTEDGVAVRVVGKGINAGNILETCAFLAGGCQCEVKAQNPGIHYTWLVLCLHARKVVYRAL